MEKQVFQMDFAGRPLVIEVGTARQTGKWRCPGPLWRYGRICYGYGIERSAGRCRFLPPDRRL